MLNLFSNLVVNLKVNIKVNLPSFKIRVSSFLTSCGSGISEIFVADHPPRVNAASLVRVVNSRLVKLGEITFRFLQG